MINLAGRPDSDRHVALELHRAGIEVRVDPELGGEVGTVLFGKLPGFTFRRAWYYWVADGQVPLDVACHLYEHPVGRRDVRVRGHCGCPPPEHPWVTYVGDDGRRLHVPGDVDRESFDRYDRGELSPLMAKAVEKVRRENQLVETEAEMQARAVRVFVDGYHIDSQEGLNLFVKALRDAGVFDAAVAQR